MEETQSKIHKRESKTQDEEDYSDITLRQFNPSRDIDDFMVWATDDRVTKFCSWDPFTCKEDAEKYMMEVIMPHPWWKAICLRDQAIGGISVSPKDVCRGEVGYVLAFKYWSKGIITRALKLVVSTIFIEWPHLQRLEALTEVDNPGSLKVLEKAGFQREGVLRKYWFLKGRARDMVIFSLLSTDLHPS